MPELISNIFGDKQWFRSLTAWGLVVWTAAQSGLAEACAGTLLPPEACATATNWLGIIGTVMTGLGIRKAATAPDVDPNA